MYIADHFSQAPTTATDGDEFEVFTVYQRNTPTEGLDCSPAQSRLMSRRTRGLLPTATMLLNLKLKKV